MNKLPRAKRIAIISALIDGCSVRATGRIVGVTKGAVLKLLADVGTVCADYQNRTLRNLTCERVQCDEIWSFVYAKARAIRQDPTIKERNAKAGDVWTWTAIDADTKLAVSWLVADRSLPSAIAFMKEVESRLANRVQLTTDSYRLYLTAVDKAFGVEVDYAQLHKVYASETTGRYSPAVCIACESKVVSGDPDPAHINTSYVERVNLGMRMGVRRFTRLTNGHSKKHENTVHAIALHFMHYNFVRIHETLRVTPAMAAGVDSRVWDVADIVNLVEQAEAKAA